MIIKNLFLILIGLYLSACAIAYKVNIDEIDNTQKGKPFEVMVSEKTINLDHVATIAKATFAQDQSEDIESLRTIIALFQFGDTTGVRVYNKNYTNDLVVLIGNKCPNGEIKNLSTVRESAEYPVISGQIVKVKGECFD